MTMLASQRVGAAMSASSHPSEASPRSMRSSSIETARDTSLASRKIPRAVSSPGTAPAVASANCRSRSSSQAVDASPHGRV
jgi:hypothetical protein